jgi:RimJ/RimL family protein N-acetyltransferase
MKAILENPENYVRHVVVEKDTSNIVGFILLNRRPNTDLQLGFWFGKKYWGKGYASEAVGALLAFLRSLGVRSRIYAAVHPKNLASQKVVEKFGFEMLKDTKKDSGVYHGMVDYSLML